MKKNSQIHLYLETELINNLKKQAETNKISISELCRRKLKDIPQLERMESLLAGIAVKLKCSTKFIQEVKMVTKLPEFKGYTVDERLKQFRKVDQEKPSIEFIDFDTEEGQELLAQYEESQEE